MSEDLVYCPEYLTIKRFYVQEFGSKTKKEHVRVSLWIRKNTWKKEHWLRWFIVVHSRSIIKQGVVRGASVWVEGFKRMI